MRERSSHCLLQVRPEPGVLDGNTIRVLHLDAISAHKAAGGTALWDALYESIALLSRAPGRKAVVVVTDGRDENSPGTGPGSSRTLAEVLSQIGETETTVYAIGLGPRVDRESLQQIADNSGGAAYFPENATTLAEQYRRVLEDLRRRYIVTYTSTNSTRDGAWRTVDISARKPGFVIRSRRGYAAPASTAAKGGPQ